MNLSTFRLFTTLVSLGMIAAACGTSASNGSGNSDGGHDATGTDGSRGVDASGVDATGAEGSSVDATGVDASGVDASGMDAGDVDAAGAEGSSAAGAGGSGDAIAGESGGDGGTEGSRDAGNASDGGKVCPLPTTFNWTSTGPLAQPQNGWVALKDFSDVVYNNQHLVYMSTVNSAGDYGVGMMTPFTDWSQMATATQYPTGGGAAPTLIYFTPKNIWVLMFEWGSCSFSYLTSTDPANPNGWSPDHCLYEGNSIDETVLCNSTTCYLFFADDNGSIYRASMPIGDFPGQFYNDSASGGNPSGPTTVMSDSTGNLFEADEVYTVKGANEYLMIVEAIASNTGHRYFRSFTATDLGGSWTPLAATDTNPFAGEANVTFSDGNAWTSDISSGDLVRTNPDETQTIDPCNLQFLYQGDAPTSGLSYNQLPWRPGLLTLVQ